MADCLVVLSVTSQDYCAEGVLVVVDGKVRVACSRSDDNDTTDTSAVLSSSTVCVQCICCVPDWLAVQSRLSCSKVGGCIVFNLVFRN